MLIPEIVPMSGYLIGFLSRVRDSGIIYKAVTNQRRIGGSLYAMPI